ncbi:hypothetical protein G6F57_020749 [Rhizopus arrhizus]|nr:hypothetical protein G6F57_020749 [Rhizopus arrhizus]
MYTKVDAKRIQRILTSTVMAAALMSALAACGGGGGSGKKSAGLPGTDIPTNPGGNNPGGTDPTNPGGTDPNTPVNPVTAGLLQTTRWILPWRLSSIRWSG